MKKMFAAAAIVIAATTAAGTPAAATPPAVNGVETPAFPLDVAGVRLGMSASEARAALVKAGYAMPATNGVSYGPSFAARVRAEAAQRRTGAATSPAMSDRVMTQLQGVGPNRETITVSLTAAPVGGSTVTSVFLTMPQDVMKGDAFLRQVVAKYGKPDGSRDQGMTLAWCSAPLKSVCGSITPFQRRPGALPNLTASVVHNDNTIRLQDGTDQDRDRERAFAAAVDDAAPKTDRAAF
ncbi:hypothetical protein SAMN05216382_1097 [Sphingomonas palmae]|uniref:Peptidoglycan binding domain-containing protein n=1 Tax=Sphingomonas palmae TaxID=1855283 RepID=A0A1H7KWV5_9SPHN|nr:hypothetical protein [Sphingomonas palmae]SEK91301.1 hypothetical protein SAMN05216382_1097 [Sphingomonas palmae]